jgi:putative aminopeptidase FrvX
MDLELLKETLSIQSKANDDKDMIEFIEKFIQRTFSNSSKKPKVNVDTYGNIYVTKGKTKLYPCIVSHIDTVHSREIGFKVYQHNTTLFAWSDAGKQVGIGGDDKVGVYVCLQALHDFDNIKVVFFRDEEIGCKGSKSANMNFFKDCAYVLQCDRKGATDFITYSNGVDLSSKEFQEKLKELNTFNDCKFTFEKGSSTDVGQLKNNGLEICCANISSGYYAAHTSYETVSISDVSKTYDLVSEVIVKMTNKPWKHIKPKEEVRSNNNAEYYRWANPSFKEGFNLAVELVFEDLADAWGIDLETFVESVKEHGFAKYPSLTADNYSLMLYYGNTLNRKKVNEYHESKKKIKAPTTNEEEFEDKDDVEEDIFGQLSILESEKDFDRVLAKLEDEEIKDSSRETSSEGSNSSILPYASSCSITNCKDLLRVDYSYGTNAPILQCTYCKDKFSYDEGKKILGEGFMKTLDPSYNFES